MDDFLQLQAAGGQQMIRAAAAEGGRRSSSTDEDQFMISSSSILINNMTTTPPSILAPPHHLPPPLRAPSFFASSTPLAEASAVKARIIAHPHYPNLVGAYVDCHKVGAPPDVAARLSAVARHLEIPQRDAGGGISEPELDQFMEAYYDMLVKYREELSRPLEEAADFLREAESQLNSISHSRSSFSGRLVASPADYEKFGACSSEEDLLDAGQGEIVLEGEPRSGERELKHQLLRKYSGFLGSLRQELSKKKKKKGKLPKEARQKLLSWWELHKKWPYPSESEKVALAESTGLNQKQINNWFINQRKRHWKPSEEMQFMVLDGYLHQQNASSFYMERHLMGDASLYRIGP